jgi:hypothetical protein
VQKLQQLQQQIFGPIAARDCPLDMSISEFFPRPLETAASGASKAVRAEMKTSLADEVLAGHAKFAAVMGERTEELDHVLGMWRHGEAVPALDYVEQLGNAAVSFDFIKVANLRNGQSANLDVCAAALAPLEALVRSPFEDHIKLALATAKFLFDSFADTVRAAVEFQRRHGGSKAAVDVSREERNQKCARCLAGFAGLCNALGALVQQPIQEASRTRRDAENLHAKLVKLLKDSTGSEQS